MKANTYVVKPFGISEVKVIALKGDPGTPTQEQVNTAVDEYMTEHPEAQIPDGSITEQKLSSDVVATLNDVDNKADKVGSYPDLIAGTADNLLSSSYQTDRTPYILRRTPYGVRDKGSIVGGSIVWNQLCNNASVTVVNGHKYLLKKDGAYSIGASTGTALTGLTVGSDMVFDLTLMFGPTIADYIYTQEQATAGAGVALAKAWAGITADYYPYDEGSVKSVEGLTAHKTTGQNRLPRNKTNETRTYADVTVSAQDGVYTITGTATSTTYVSFELEEPIDMSPSTTKICFLNNVNDTNLAVGFYRGSTRVHYWRMLQMNLVASGWNDSGNEVVDRIALQIQSGATYNMTVSPMFVYLDVPDADTFEPYIAHEYPLDSSLTLRGRLMLDGDSIYYDGDIYPPSGEVERRYAVRAYQSGDESDANVLTDGTNTVYKLATPTTEQAEPYTALQICDPAGTEEWVGANMPVGHDTKYYADLKGKIEDIPDAPSANGTYVLKATVSSSGVTYAWIAG